MSEEKAEISKELFDSVCDAVGQRSRASVWKVQVELRGDKMETRILALVSYRAFLITARVPSKVEHSFSFLDIQGISSNKPNQVLLDYDRGQWTLQLGSVEQVDQVLVYLGTSLMRICPNGPALKLLRKLVLSPPDRTCALQACWDQQTPPDPGPCGGFSHQYWCVCDQLGMPYREEVQWDVDTIYLTQDTRELNLQDFIHLENRDLVAIIAVLEYNEWFTKLSTKDYKLPTDVWEQVLRVVSRSPCLQELLLDNAGLKSDFAIKLAGALLHSPACCIHTLNLANNALEDKGVCALSAQLAKLPLGLKHLNLSKNSLSAKGVNTLCMALCANPAASSTLTHLDLSSNCLRGDELPNLHNFLSQPNCVETLDLSNSDCALDQVCASLLKGSLKHLKVLYMSKNVFSHRRSKEVPPTFKQFFGSAQALKTVSLSGTRLPLEALKSLLLGLGCNPNLSEVSLDISCCELRSGGSQILEGCIAEIPNISSLDISDNGLDMDLSTLLVWLARNRSIQHLSLGKNFSNIKSKNVSHVLDNLVHMIQEEESPLTSLSLAESRLKADLSVVLNALGSNSSLTRLDVSGNAMGDMGAKMLAKALQINTKLRTLIWDRNNISPQGLQDVAAALEKNYTIRFMPMPIVDAAQALKTSPEKTEDALLKMEQYLLRNHETRKYLQEQAYRLQQGIVTTTTQQLVDRMCVKVQDHLNSLRFSENKEVQEDMRTAQNLMMDARNAKRLLPNLYHLPGAGARGPCVEAIQDTMEAMAGQVSQVIDQQLQVLLSSMVDRAESVCPHVMRRSSLKEELVEACGSRMEVPRSFITSALLEQSGVDITNKISEVKLNLASLLSDRIVDEILDSLSVSQHSLAGHVTKQYQPRLHSALPPEAELLDERVLKVRHPDLEQPEDHREDPGLMNPRSKRRSILVRMLRPVSVAFEMEFDLDKALEEVPIHVEDLPPPPPPTQPLPDSQSYSDLPSPPPLILPTRPLTLPSAEGVKLEHHTKLRPKPPNRTKPSRVRLRRPSSSEPQGAEQSLLGKLDHGLDAFFHRTVNRLSFRQGTPGSSGTTQEVVDRKRESRRSGFLQLLKPCPSRSSITALPPTTVVMVTEEETGGEVQLKDPPAEPQPPSTKNSPPGPSRENEGEKEEEKEEKEGYHPALHHFGVPVLGLDLLAEMKARQERKAAIQKASFPADGHAGPPPTDLSDQPPGPAPRSRPPKPPLGPRGSGPSPPSTTSRPSSTTGPEERSTREPLPAPLPAPRLKKPSEQKMEEASLGGAESSEQKMEEASLGGAESSEQKMEEASLGGAESSEQKMEEASLGGAESSEQKMEEASLGGAESSEQKMEEASLGGAESSEQKMEASLGGAESPPEAELLGDSSAFDSPDEGSRGGGRQWSSLKNTPPLTEELNRQRAKSLPSHAGQSDGSEPGQEDQRPVESEEDSSDDEDPSI